MSRIQRTILIELMASESHMIQLDDTAEQNSGFRVRRIRDEHVRAEAMYNAVERVLHSACGVKMSAVANQVLWSEHCMHCIRVHIPMKLIRIARIQPSVYLQACAGC